MREVCPPPSPQAAHELGNIAVVFRGMADLARLERPVGRSKRPVKEHAKRGAFLGEDHFPGSSASSDLYGFAFSIAWLPVGALVGAVSGPVLESVAQKREPKLQQAFTAVTNALAKARFEQSLQDRILDGIRRNTRHSVALAPASVLLTKDELKQDGISIDTLLYLSLEEAALRSDQGIGSGLALSAHLQFRVVRITGGKELDDDDLEFRSGKRSLIDWGAANAQPLRTAIQSCEQTLADRVVRRLFLQAGF